MSAITAEWRDVVGYDGRYQVSSLGCVCSYARHKRQVLIPRQHGDGYLTVRLFFHGGAANRKIHSLVAEAFIGPRPLGADVNHRDGNKANNCIANLEYATRSENVRHAYRTGLIPDRSGERNSNSKVSAAQVSEIQRRAMAGESARVLASEFEISVGHIRKIIRGDHWRAK